MSITLDGSNLTTVGVINSATAQASTSGTSITFSSIPSGTKRITIMFNGVGTTGSVILFQIGSGSVTTSGYASSALVGNTGGTGNITSTAGFVHDGGTGSGIYTLALIGSNTWVGTGISGSSGTLSWASGNSPALSGALDRVVVTTVSGTATFNAGSINILYE